MLPKPLFCINPHCQQPNHPNNNDSNLKYCQSCGSELLLNNQFRVSRLLSDTSGFGDVYEVFKGFSACILKVLKPQWNNEPKAIELFKREYDVLAQLTTQGITAIPQAIDYFEYQTKDGLNLYCLVMEKVEGIDLIQWLNNNGKINQNQTLKWLREIVNILDIIHSKNYFHRDLKPANIMMRNNGELVLIDFGTAREETQTYFQKVQGQQITGIISAGYTPIEQKNGQALIQSDFFALGRTFVHLLTGKHPLELYDGSKDVLNWRKYTENTNILILDLIDNLMARIADDRPQNTKAILRKLDQIEQKLKLPITQSQNNLMRNILITVVSISLLILGGFNLYKYSPVIRQNESISTKNNEFILLETYLQQSKWKKADVETDNLIKELGYSCEVLTIVNNLWLEYSNNHFGYSIQINIWQNIKGNKPYDVFANQVGWKNNNEQWLKHDQLNFSINAPVGHLPWHGWQVQENETTFLREGFGDFMSTLKQCQI
jgi:serine/threonine protein kinase